MNKTLSIILAAIFCVIVGAGIYLYTKVSDSFEVTISNASQDRSVYGGVLLVHGTDISLNFLGNSFPEDFSDLPLLGNPDNFINAVKELKKQNKKLYQVIRLDELSAGENLSVLIDKTPEDATISIVYKVAKSEDTIAIIKSYPLYTKKGEKYKPNEFKHFFNLIDAGLTSGGVRTPGVNAFLSTDVPSNILSFDLKYGGKK